MANLYNADGTPRRVACYMAKRDKVADPYTIVFTRISNLDKRYVGRVLYVGANGTPYHPASGFYQHGEADRREFRPCGSRVPFSSLPPDLRQCVLEEYRDIWEGERESVHPTECA